MPINYIFALSELAYRGKQRYLTFWCFKLQVYYKHTAGNKKSRSITARKNEARNNSENA